MTALANLKLVAAKKPAQLSPVVQRRSKVAKRIAEQIALAQAKQDGKPKDPNAPKRTRGPNKPKAGAAKKK